MITIKSFEVNYFSENTYLLYDDTKEAVLIDCGCLRKEEQKEVSDFIAQNGLTLKRYLCTHLHLDHIFGNEFVHNTYGLSPEAHKADVEGLPSPEEQAKAFGLPMKAKSVPVGKYLVNGEIIKFGKSELAVLSVPDDVQAPFLFRDERARRDRACSSRGDRRGPYGLSGGIGEGSRK